MKRFRQSFAAMSKDAISFALVAAGTFAAFPACSQEMREVEKLPKDCRSVLPPGTVGTFQNWQVFVRLEHCDRIKRLIRISQSLPVSERPKFYESYIPKERLPFEYDIDIPVLRVVFPDKVFFDTAADDLRYEADEIVRIVAESLRNEPPDVAVFVAGHADSRGDSNMNEALSIDRADAIATRIFQKGVNYSAIWRIGFGEDMPLFAGDSDYEWGQNRRVEFLFSAKPEPIGVWLSDQQLGGLCKAKSLAESERCKSKLTMLDDYPALRVTSAKRTKAVVRLEHSAKRKRIAPRKPAAISEFPSTGTPRVGATPTIKRMVVIPRLAPKIIINPVNRQPDPIKIIL